MNDILDLRIRDAGDAAVVNSRDLAEIFGKRHGDILRDINGLEIDAKLRRSWFRETATPDTYGRLQPGFDLTKDGFVLLVMGWTGEKAMRFKVRYIEAFNTMEAQCRNSVLSLRGVDLEAIEKIIDQRIEEKLARNPLVAVTSHVSVLELLNQSGANPKKRNGINRIIGNDLRRLCAETGGARRCPRTRTWLFPIDLAHKYMRSRGNSLVAYHNDRVGAQGNLFLFKV